MSLFIIVVAAGSMVLFSGALDVSFHLVWWLLARRSCLSCLFSYWVLSVFLLCSHCLLIVFLLVFLRCLRVFPLLFLLDLTRYGLSIIIIITIGGSI